MSVFDRMQKVGVQPDRFAYQIAISSCIYMESKTESWQKAVALLLECDRTLPLDGTGGSVEGKLAVSIFAAAISVCERAAQGRAALKLYDLMSQRKQLPRPDVVMISSIVAACEIDSDWAKLDDVLEGSGVVPDLILYHQLIRIAGKKFDPLAAFHHLRAAIRQGLQPTRGTYRELVEACQISVESIPRGAFLLEQAKLLLNRAYPGVVAENDNDSGSSGTGPKADFMLDGSKCTTTNGPGGDYEPSTRKMLKMLETTTPFRLHDTSALPESGHRISFQAAQELLAMHCEKQALAALLENAPVSTDSNGKIDNTIRLAVSLCMCADCHMVFKYASEGYNRRIECSDPSRTHCFERGECSCLDNWPGKARAVISKQVHIGTFL